MLVLKAGEWYLRRTADGISACALDKASVFPLAETGNVLALLAQVRKGAYPEATIRVLELIEKPYSPKAPGIWKRTFQPE